MTKTIVITGANGNLGTATVKKFLEEGYRVVAIDRSDSHLSFAAGNSSFFLYNVDLTNEENVTAFVEELINKYGSIEGALMLAGGFAMGHVHTTNGDDLKKMFALNFETAYYLSRLLFVHMLDRGYGRLVFMGARGALLAEQGKNMIAYSLSKSQLFSYASLLNAEANKTNVVASMVVPSTIDTAVNRIDMPDADFSNWVKADEIATLLEFICSENGSALREPIYKIYNKA